jgi:TolB-like protein
MYAVLNKDPAPLPMDVRGHPLTDLTIRLLSKDPAARIGSADGVATVVAQISEDVAKLRRQNRSHRRLLVWAAVSVLIVAVAIGWGLPRVARPSRASSGLAVLPFENMVDPQDRSRLGPVIGSLLITAVVEAHADSVPSSERILDIMNGLGRVGGPMDRSLARAVAQRANARRIVTGSILRMDPAVVVTAEVSETASGQIVDAARIDGVPGQSVFDVASALGCRIAHALAPAPVATVSSPTRGRGTNDLLADQSYVNGLERLARGEIKQARQSFSAALERDSSFQQASYQLGFTYWLDAGPARESP